MLCVNRQYSRHQAAPILNRTLFTLAIATSLFQTLALIAILDSPGLTSFTLLEVHEFLSDLQR